MSSEMAETSILLPQAVLTDGEAKAPLWDVAIRIDGDCIAEIGHAGDIVAAHPKAEIIDLADCVVMPGLVNAHQHGRGLSAMQQGGEDEYFELINAARTARRSRGSAPVAPRHEVQSPGSAPIVALACAEMLRNGVTCTIQANLYFDGEDYESELRSVLRAYVESGIRACVCVGAQDQGWIVYPQADEPAFLAGLPDDMRDDLSRIPRTAYAGDAPSTIALMDRLLADYHDHPRIRLLYGPGGPQWLTDKSFTAMAEAARGQGVGFHFHCLETRAQQAALQRIYPEGVMAHLDGLGVLGPQTSLAHCVFLTADDIELAARRGVTLVRNPGSNLRLHNGSAPLAKFLAYGARVAIGTDNRALEEGEDLLKEVRLAQALARSAEWGDPPAPNARQLFSMATANGAHAAGFGTEVGVLEARRKADLIALSLHHIRGTYLDAGVSLVDAVIGRAEGRDVRMTMVDGRIVYRDGVLQSMDENEVRTKALTAADASHQTMAPKELRNLQTLRNHLAAHYRNMTAAQRPRR
jgi:cytosine/adenosine deaminase-related metal-dependent hydrolase